MNTSRLIRKKNSRLGPPKRHYEISVYGYIQYFGGSLKLTIVESLLSVELEVEPVTGELLLGGGHHRLEGVLQQVVAPNVQSRVEITNQS